MTYNAVLFDLDGTLLDTLDDLADSVNRVLIAQGFPAHPVDEYRYFVGEGARLLVTRALPEAQRDEATIQKSLALFHEDYGQHWKDKTRPYAGIPNMLDALSERGLKLTILSNKPDMFTKQCVAALLPNWTFDIIFGQREGTPRKPNPAGAIEIARLLNLPPSEVLYLGDTAIDMKTAGGAGMFPVGALWGFRTREELLENGAKVLLKQPVDILNILL